VKLGQHSRTGVHVAIKVIKMSHFRKSPDLSAKVHREIALMRLFRHPHLLSLVDVCKSAHHPYMILEYAPHGELFDFLLSSQGLTVDAALRLFRRLIYGVQFLHSHAICHRDLKPENILLDEYDNVKIGDFGFARWMRANVAETSCGSPHYAAPEVIRGIPYDGRAADIWSCGGILFALLAGRLPFHDQAIGVLLAKVKAGQDVMPDFPPPIQSLISSMLTVDPDRRITIDGVKAHPAFRIGLCAPAYVCPTPLPRLADPVDPAAVDPGVLLVLRQIGFCGDGELEAGFAARGTSWAKVFHHMLTATFALDALPWEPAAEPAGDADDRFIVSPERLVTFAVQNSDPFRRPRAGPASRGYSLAERAAWASIGGGQYKADLVQPCVDIPIPLDLLMAKMQAVLQQMGLQ
jgi:BR serine/threonine kinase